ncbi:MAG: hypothetical protein IV100_01760 [Myxococcales bacterium]|nr:hypothetical protein [Myxococcales bacterium]
MLPRARMSDEVAVNLTKEDGGVEQIRVPISATYQFVCFFVNFVVGSRVAFFPQLGRQQLVDVSDDIAQLTCVTMLTVGSRSALVS